MHGNNLGRITAINGNLITVETEKEVMQNEVAHALLDESRLKSEIIRMRESKAELQVFEETRGLKVGDLVEFTGELLSVELGPGLLGQVYDGLQNPLQDLKHALLFF